MPFFLPKFCFLCSRFLKHLVEWQTVSALFAHAILSARLVYEILRHLTYNGHHRVGVGVGAKVLG